LSHGSATTGGLRESELPGGIRLITEAIPSVRSIALGIWVRQGSAHESPDSLGASHLLEHMVFKGTGRRTARDLVLALERLGGSLDAFTSREHTAYQARVLGEHLPVALDVLADLVTDPLLREDDLALEREVVLEELSTVEDTPDDLVFELHGEALWEGSSLRALHPWDGGFRPVHERRDAQAPFMTRATRHGELIVAGAGDLQHEDPRWMIWPSAFWGSETWPCHGPWYLTCRSCGGVAIAHDRVGQPRHGADAHRVSGAAHRRDPLGIGIRSAFSLRIMGGGMSSRLFQRVREELGLCYSIYTFQSFYSKAGDVRGLCRDPARRG
jgi:hypothetical protein